MTLIILVMANMLCLTYMTETAGLNMVMCIHNKYIFTEYNRKYFSHIYGVVRGC